LVAVIDWYSRRVLSWRISNSMDAVFCVDCLEDALREHGKPEVRGAHNLEHLVGTPLWLFQDGKAAWAEAAAARAGSYIS